MALNSSLFLSAEINEIVQSPCSPNYYVFQSVSPYSPILNLSRGTKFDLPRVQIVKVCEDKKKIKFHIFYKNLFC